MILQTINEDNSRWPTNKSEYILSFMSNKYKWTTNGLNKPFDDPVFGGPEYGYGCEFELEFENEKNISPMLGVIQELSHELTIKQDIPSLVKKYKVIPIELNQYGVIGHTNRCVDGKLGILLTKKENDIIAIHILNSRDALKVRREGRPKVMSLYSKM